MIPIMITNRDYLLNSSFQQAVIRNINDRNAQLQKQLENVVREGKEECHLFLTFLLLTIPLLANGEISLLSNKVTREQFSSLYLDVVEAEGPIRI